MADRGPEDSASALTPSPATPLAHRHRLGRRRRRRAAPGALEIARAQRSPARPWRTARRRWPRSALRRCSSPSCRPERPCPSSGGSRPATAAHTSRPLPRRSRNRRARSGAPDRDRAGKRAGAPPSDTPVARKPRVLSGRAPHAPRVRVARRACPPGPGGAQFPGRRRRLLYPLVADSFVAVAGHQREAVSRCCSPSPCSPARWPRPPAPARRASWLR